MLKYTMMKMTDKHAALKRLSALVFAAMLLLGMAAAAETDPLKPDDKSYENGNVELHKQAERIAPDEWKIDVSATIKDSPVEPQQLEVRFVLDFTQSMLGCMHEEDHQLWEETKIQHTEHQARSVTFNNACVYELVCTDTHEHGDACYRCIRPLYSHSGSSYCKDYSSGTTVNLPTRMAAEQTAVVNLTDHLPTGTDIVYYSFAGENSFGDLVGFETVTIEDLRTKPAYYFPWNTNTMLNEGVTRFFNEVGFTNANNKKILIIVTDGESHDGYPSGVIQNFKTNQNGSVFVVGFNYDNAQLAALAGNGGKYIHASSADSLYSAFDEIEKTVMTMITDPMGNTVSFDVDSIVDGESQVDGSVTYSDNTLYWNPNSGSEIANKKIAYSYTVKLNSNADLSVGVHENQPLNDDTYFKYGLKGGEMKSALFPQPIAHYAISSVQVMWKDENGNDIGSEDVLPEYMPTDVEAVFSDYTWTQEDGLHELYEPAFETDYVTITEEIPLADGSRYQYVDTTYTADGTALSGVEDVDASQPVAYVITHNYRLVQPGELVIEGTKYIDGATFDRVSDDKGNRGALTYTFELKSMGNGKKPLPEGANGGKLTLEITPQSGNSAAISFGTIRFTEPGTYEYQIIETPFSKNTHRVHCDETVYTLVVTVDGNMQVTTNLTAKLGETTSDAQSIVFRNVYPTTGALKITKKVADPTNQKADFTFHITTDNATFRDDMKNWAAKNGGTFDEDAGALVVQTGELTPVSGAAEKTITLSDFPTGTFTVTEIDADDYKVTYQVNGGTASEQAAAVTVLEDAETAVAVTNTYKVGSLKIVKTVKPATGVTVPETAKFTVTGPNNYRMEVLYSQFENGAYTLTDLPVGEYTVTEDETTAQVTGYTLSVTGDNGTPVTVQASETAQAEIVNTYVQEKTEAAVRKVWLGNEQAIPESLTVELVKNETPSGATVILDADNGWYGEYGSLNVYDIYGEPIVYSWREVNAPAYYSLTDVTVDGTLTTLTNTYTPAPVSAGIAVRKTLNGRTLNVGEFSFELKDAAGEVVQTKKNDATGNVTFDEITYTAAGTYTYTITEVSGTLSGVTYDNRTVTATVTVTDNHQGVLEAEVS